MIDSQRRRGHRVIDSWGRVSGLIDSWPDDISWGVSGADRKWCLHGTAFCQSRGRLTSLRSRMTSQHSALAD